MYCKRYYVCLYANFTVNYKSDLFIQEDPEDLRMMLELASNCQQMQVM